MAASSEMRRRRPCAALRGLVDGYDGYRLENVPSRLHRGLPSRHLTVVFSFGKPLDLAASPDPGQAPDRYAALIGGLHARPARISMSGVEHGIQLRLTPLGARRLFGVTSAEMGPGVLHLADLLGRRIDSLMDRLAAAGGFAAQFDVLDEALTRLLPDLERSPRPEVLWAWRRIVASRGAAPVSAVAADVGWSRRHLGEQFRREYGLPPKVVARVLRFEQATQRLRRRPGTPLTQVAADTGYADQAHFTREFRELAGCPPGRWLAEEFPFVQDTAAAEW